MARQYKQYVDIDSQRTYDENGDEQTARSKPYIYAKEEIQLTIQYARNFKSITDFDAYTGFTGINISSSAVVDNDFNHVDKGLLVDASLTGAITSVEISGLSNTPQPAGEIQLINAGGESDLIPYTSVSSSGGNYIFVVNSTLDNSYVAGNQANANDPALIKTLDANIDSTAKDTGLFIITLDADSLPYLLQIEGTSEISNCKFEHKVIDDRPKPIFVASFDFQCKNTLDDDGALPPPSSGSNYYTKVEIDALLSSKMDKQPTATTGNIAEFDATGGVIDSGFSFADFGIDVTNQSTALLSMTGTTTASGTVGNVILPVITGEIFDVELNVKYPITYAGGEVTITAPENIVTLFAIDKYGLVVQSNPPVDCIEARDKIFISAARTQDGVNVDNAIDFVVTSPYSPALTITDISDVLGAISKSKNILTANGANLSINTAEFDLTFIGINFLNKKCPNRKTLSSKSAPTIVQYYRNGAGLLNSLESSSIDPTKWDDGTGTLATVGANTFTNVNFYINPQGEGVSLFFGRTLYSSQAGALAGITQDIDSINTDLTFRPQYYIGTVTVRNDSTLLNDTTHAIFSEGQKVAKFYDNISKLGDGLIQNEHTVAFGSNGTISTITLTATNENFIELQLDGQPYELASPASINLLHGTDISPKANYVYITEVGGTAQLNVSESDPMVSTVGLFANVWQGSVASATYSGTAKGPKTYQKKTDYFGSASNQSYIRIANDHFRRSALVRSGVVPTSTPAVGGGTDTTVYIDTSAGLVDQLTPHTRNVYSSLTDGFEVPNDETTAFSEYNGLHELTTDANGDSLTSNNRIAVFFAFGTQDEDGTYAKTFVNKPNGYYSDQTAAIADAAKTAIYDYPAGFEGTAFPIALYITKYTSGANYEVLAVTDLTGGLGGEGGGSSAGVTNFLGMTDTPTIYTGSENYSVKVNATGTGLEFVATGAGESNTISSVGTAGAELSDGKVGVDLQVRKLNSLSSAITIVADAGNKKVDVDLIEGNITISASQVSNFASALAGTTNTTPFTPIADYHVSTKKYVDDNVASSVWGAIESTLTNYTIVNATDQNKWFQLSSAATAERTITTDPTSADKFNFWVSSENATYDVVVAGGEVEVLDNIASSTAEDLYSGSIEGLAECYSNTGSFNKVTVKLNRNLNPTGLAYVRIYDITGTIEVDAKPTGSVLAEGSIDVSTLTAGGPDNYEIKLDSVVNADDIAISVEYSGGDSSNYIRVYYNGANPITGNLARYASSSWAYWTNNDLSFISSLTETINGSASVTISKDNANPVQFIKNGSDYQALYYEESAGGGADLSPMIYANSSQILRLNIDKYEGNDSVLESFEIGGVADFSDVDVTSDGTENATDFTYDLTGSEKLITSDFDFNETKTDGFALITQTVGTPTITASVDGGSFDSVVMELIGTVSGTVTNDIPQSEGTATAISDNGGGYEVANAFDGNSGTRWMSGTSSNLNDWIKKTYSASRIFSGFIIEQTDSNQSVTSVDVEVDGVVVDTVTIGVTGTYNFTPSAGLAIELVAKTNTVDPAYNWSIDELQFIEVTLVEAHKGSIPVGQTVQLDIQDCTVIDNYGIYAK